MLGYNGRKLGSTNCATGGLAAVEAVLDDSQVASMDLDSAQGWFVVSLGEGKRVQLYNMNGMDNMDRMDNIQAVPFEFLLGQFDNFGPGGPK